MLLCLALMFSVVTPAYALGRNNTIKPLAWPGRPGGNGDGSEEWMSGSYGQMNGPYKLLRTSTGTVEDFNNGVARIRNLRNSIFELASHFSLTVNIIYTAIQIDDLFQEDLVGQYYVYRTYVSGRRMKIVIDTYWGANQTHFARRYEKEILW